MKFKDTQDLVLALPQVCVFYRFSVLALLFGVFKRVLSPPRVKNVQGGVAGLVLSPIGLWLFEQLNTTKIPCVLAALEGPMRHLHAAFYHFL